MKFESQHLSKTYKTAYRIIPALEDVIFSVMEKEFVCMVGPVGAVRRRFSISSPNRCSKYGTSRRSKGKRGYCDRSLV